MLCHVQMSAESVPALLEVVVALAASPTLAEVLAPAPPPAQANELNPAARSAPSSNAVTLKKLVRQ